MWRYKIDILKELSNRGYTSTKLRKDKISNIIENKERREHILWDMEY